MDKIDSIIHVSNLIKKHNKDIAFIIGNGLNLYCKTTRSWSDLLNTLFGNSDGIKTATAREKLFKEGLLYTEYYDILKMRNHPCNKNENKITANCQLANNIVELHKKISDNTPDQTEQIKKVVNCIKKLSCPIITTNYDHFLEGESYNNKHYVQGASFTDYYPWSVYYNGATSKKQKQSIPQPNEKNILNEFAIWHMHGSIDYKRSIKIGLRDYATCIHRAQNFISNPAEKYSLISQSQCKNWKGRNTWLNLIFNKSLFIFGLGLETNEVFLRWLLIQRALYFEIRKISHHKGWYLTSKEDPVSEGKRWFLKHLGFDVIELESRKEVYEGIWEKL